MEIRDRIQALMLLVGLMVVVGCFFSLQSDSNVTTEDIQETVKAEVTSNYEYDDANRLTAIHYSDGFHVQFIYDQEGNLTERREYHDKDAGDSGPQLAAIVSQENS
ncbi:MAG: RHS repeat domain-containing protein [Candidatus Hinthialibacter antarcticus]|nr:RHS repeat domain-containing protein [Candidatus Hinthialibacter antarcticus]